MTAALVCTVLESEDTELHLVVGARPDLLRVANGTEQAVAASMARVHLDRAMAPYLGVWRRWAQDRFLLVLWVLWVLWVLAHDTGLKIEAPQLPTEPPAFVTLSGTGRDAHELRPTPACSPSSCSRI